MNPYDLERAIESNSRKRWRMVLLSSLLVIQVCLLVLIWQLMAIDERLEQLPQSLSASIGEAAPIDAAALRREVESAIRDVYGLQPGEAPVTAIENTLMASFELDVSDPGSPFSNLYAWLSDTVGLAPGLKTLFGDDWEDIEANLRALIQTELAGALAAGSRDPDSSRSIMFEFGSAELEPNADAIIRAISVLARGDDVLRIRLSGHADTIGDRARNQALSEERVRAVRQRLIEAGIPEAKLVSNGSGETAPPVPTPDETREPRNRSVEVVIERTAAAVGDPARSRGYTVPDHAAQSESRPLAGSARDLGAARDRRGRSG